MSHTQPSIFSPGAEDRYRSLLGLMPAGVYTCEAPSGVISFFNEQAATLAFERLLARLTELYPGEVS